MYQHFPWQAAIRRVSWRV